MTLHYVIYKRIDGTTSKNIGTKKTEVQTGPQTKRLNYENGSTAVSIGQHFEQTMMSI
jgi:hypothetical protein